MKKTNYKYFRPAIFSRHPSHNVLRSSSKNLPLFPFKSVIRLGSTTEINDGRVEINSIESIKKSANKELMKIAFIEAGVCTAEWEKGCGYITFDSDGIYFNDVYEPDTITYPLVAKAKYGSKGRGNTLIRHEDEFVDWKDNHDMSNYIFEKYYGYALEYRLHVTKFGCFYACRKALKADAPEDQRWRRHDDICVWLLESNPDFRKPNSWNMIVEHCVKALNQIGADILSFDVKVQSEKASDGSLRSFQNFILLECNSASSMDNGSGEISMCAQKYIEILPKLIINKKYESR
jgi:hypothetical protein